jgi:hypothetical protein
MHRFLLPRIAALFAVSALALVALVVPAFADGGSRTLFISSAHENPDGTVTLPLHRGTSHGQSVFYIVLDTSSGALSSALGVNESQKLANAVNALNSKAVQKVNAASLSGSIDFPGTVDFSPVRQVAPTPGSGFPPSEAQPGAVADAFYSPLIQLTDGTIVNAPHVANASGQADKVVSLDLARMTVTYRETNGEQGGKAVRYVSTDASNPVAAALENATFVDRLNNAPTVGDDSTDSSRASLAAFINGQTGANNPNRQGLNSALLDGLDPLNVLRWNPSQGRYSPLWDVHLGKWSDAAVKAGLNTRQTDFGQVLNLASDGLVTAPDGSAFAASGFIVDCPLVSSD